MNIMADEEPTVASCCNYAVLPSLQQRTMPVDTARRLQASSVRVIACTGETTGFVVQLRGHKLLATTRGAVSSAKDASGCRLVFADGRAYVSRSEDVVAVRTHTQRTPWHALIQPVAWSHLHLCLCSVNVTFVRFVDKVFADVDITLELPPQSADCRTSPGCGVVHGDLEPPASSLGDDDTSTVMASPTPSTNLDTTAMQLAIPLLAAPVSTADAAANSTGARGDATKPHPTGLLDKAMELLDNADAGCEVRNWVRKSTLPKRDPRLCCASPAVVCRIPCPILCSNCSRSGNVCRATNHGREWRGCQHRGTTRGPIGFEGRGVVGSRCRRHFGGRNDGHYVRGLRDRR